MHLFILTFFLTIYIKNSIKILFMIVRDNCYKTTIYLFLNYALIIISIIMKIYNSQFGITLR